QLSSTDGQIVNFRWTRCYAIIFRANNLISAINEVTLDESIKDIYLGEAHFLRGLAYSLLAESYGGVPLILSEISTEEARNVNRSSLVETWNQVIMDYNFAINVLPKDAFEVGRATKGAALGMKMRAYLYQSNF